MSKAHTHRLNPSPGLLQQARVRLPSGSFRQSTGPLGWRHNPCEPEGCRYRTKKRSVSSYGAHARPKETFPGSTVRPTSTPDRICKGKRLPAAVQKTGSDRNDETPSLERPALQEIFCRSKPNRGEARGKTADPFQEESLRHGRHDHLLDETREFGSGQPSVTKGGLRPRSNEGRGF